MQKRILGLLDRPPARSARIGDHLAYWATVLIGLLAVIGIPVAALWRP